MIGIIGAMQSEITLLLAAMEQTQQVQIGNKVYYTGLLKGKEVVLTQSGMGKVNAAMCAQILIDRFGATALLNTGIAGGVAKGLHVGDIVVSTKAVEHDFDLTPVGYVKGCFGGDKSQPTYFPADPAMLEALYEAAVEVLSEQQVHKGCIATGDVFVGNRELKLELREVYDAYAAEMEGGAILHVACENGVPAAILRCISDLADEGAHESIDNFEQVVADRSAAILMAMVGRYTAAGKEA